MRAILAERSLRLRISAVGAAELAAIVSRQVGTGTFIAARAEAALALFDRWSASRTATVEIAPEDHAVAARFVRQLDTKLAARDALHLAIAHRLGLALLTFENRQAAAAAALGIACDPAGTTVGAWTLIRAHRSADHGLGSGFAV